MQDGNAGSVEETVSNTGFYNTKFLRFPVNDYPQMEQKKHHLESSIFAIGN